MHGREGREGGVLLEQLEFVHLGQGRGTLTLPSSPALRMRMRISCEGERVGWGQRGGAEGWARGVEEGGMGEKGGTEGWGQGEGAEGWTKEKRGRKEGEIKEREGRRARNEGHRMKKGEKGEKGESE